MRISYAGFFPSKRARSGPAGAITDYPRTSWAIM